MGFDRDLESASTSEQNGDEINTSVEDEPEKAIVKRYGSFGPWLQLLFANGVEARGVERVPESQREIKNFWNK